MKKKVLTLQDVRDAIHCVNDEELSEYINSISDEELLASSFHEDLGMDSLDVIELMLEIERMCTVSIPDAAYETIVAKGGTVQALLETCNEIV